MLLLMEEGSGVGGGLEAGRKGRERTDILTGDRKALWQLRFSPGSVLQRNGRKADWTESCFERNGVPWGCREEQQLGSRRPGLDPAVWGVRYTIRIRDLRRRGMCVCKGGCCLEE
jgi:hypothetical protein